jgi:HprK-related kinase A
MTLADLSGEELSARLSSRNGLALQLGPFILRLQVALHELHPAVGLLYAEHEIAHDESICDFWVRLIPRPGLAPWTKRARFVIDDCPTFDPFARALALPMLEWAINWCTFSRPHQFFMLHSAVLEKHHQGILLPGPPGAGKSTLCAALALRGWRLLSDELAMTRPGHIDLIPVPRPIGLKNASIDVIRAFEPGAIIGPVTTGTRKGTVAHLKPPRAALHQAQQPARPRWIVFPAFKAGAAATLEPASKAQTFLWLANDAFNFHVLGETAFDALSELIDACDCYELTYGDLDEAITRLNALIDGDGSSAT